jgi:hypothetical protein
MTVFVTSFILPKWWYIKFYCITSLFVTFVFTEAAAQVLQTKRFEFPLFYNEKNFDVIPAGEDGLYLHRQFSTDKLDQLHLIKLDTAFQEKWSGFLSVERNYVVMGRRAFNNRLFLLLRYKDYSKNDLIMFSVNEKDGSYIRYAIKSFIPFAPTEFQLTSKAALIGGYYNHVPVVLYFSFAALKSRVLPGLFNESGELTQIRTYPDETFDVLISSLNVHRQRTIWIKNYDAEGSLYRNFALTPEDNKHLIFGRSLKTGQDMQLVAGVYGNNRSAEFSRGIFIASIDPSGMEQVRYYNFADLHNFFKYMRAKREQRIQSRIDRKKVKGKKIRFNYRFLVHELIPYNNQYILLGEAFYPRYLTADNPYGRFFTPYMNPNAIIQNGRIFDGYYYTHAVVMCFDKEGNLLWDNSFEINDVRTFTLEQFVKLEVEEDRIALLYLYDNEFRTKIIKGDQVLEGKTRDRILTFNQSDLVKNENAGSKLEYWYKDYLYAYGIQEIVNTGPPNPGKRRVFYINKVSHSK